VTLSPAAAALLRLTLVEGVGPVLGRRLIESFGDAQRVFDATPHDLERVRGIGDAKSRRMFESLRTSAERLDAELAAAHRIGARYITMADAAYPALLAQCPDAPLALCVRGADPCPPGSFPVGIVGSRHCTHYGLEQADRFSTALAQAGLLVVSGGARGIDSAAHLAATRLRAPTVVVLGCGLGHCYPPENAELFEQVVATGGTLLSELPVSTSPAPENFPARNRLIVGLSLGVVVIEAPRGSGALITARLAIDDYNREVAAVPGRVDSRASEGSNALIKSGEAAMVTAPADVIELLESAARHLHAGTHAPRFGSLFQSDADDAAPAPASIQSPVQSGAPARAASAAPSIGTVTPEQAAVLAALEEPRTLDDLCRVTNLAASAVQAAVALLEIRRVVVRRGSMLERARRG
jgi:DNA processing protein